MGSAYLFRSPSVQSRILPLATADDAGGKGAGLLRLPTNWYPPTVFVSPALHGAYVADPSAVGVIASSEELSRIVGGLVEGDPQRMLLVRSSAAAESIDARGQFESRLAGQDLESISEAAREIWGSAGDEQSMGLLLQPALRVQMSGHLSNEYRLSRDSNLWVYEVQLGGASKSTRRTAQWRVVSNSRSEGLQLDCRTTSELEQRLREVAAVLSELPYRHHLEWVWDGSRVWIVQCDRVPVTVGPAPGDAWQPTVGISLTVADLKAWTLLDDESLDAFDRWPKTRALRTFSSVSLPMAQLWALAGDPLQRAISSGWQDEELIEDLRLLCSGHVVVRTDIAGDSAEFMLPKTTAQADPDEIRDFLRDTSAQLQRDGIAVERICFLAHRFLRARACAWAAARPGDPLVQLDGTWGLPDGLAWLPHDSFWVNIDSGRTHRSVNGKTAFLDVEQTSSWTYRQSPTEWIWRSSLTDDQLRTMAKGSAAVAERLARPVLIMWFVGLLDGADSECLPWFMDDYLPHSIGEAQVAPAAQRVVIRTQQDLDRLPEDLTRTGAQVVRLFPGPELVRSKRFVDQVVEGATDRDVVVELVGSPLAHPYYMLKEAGLTVTCVDTFDAPRTDFKKLVRDNIPSQISERGERVVSFRADDSQRERLLRLKVIEESMELARTRSPLEALEEIADVEEVLEALRKNIGLTRQQVRDSRTRKRMRRGGFEEAQVLVSTGGTEHQTNPPPLADFSELAVGLTTWHVQREPGRVLVNALPPLEGDPKVFEVQLGGLVVRIRYTESIIALEAIDEPDPGDETAVALFDDGLE